MTPTSNLNPTESNEITLVVGTAGHIDHGKTELVKALTGINCDRLIEEKKRGITIELGFAPLRLPSGRTISLIDVPGHERFIRQMVSGASGIDATILVIAADESVMPQTREHLDILCLLGVKHGIIAVTKKDLVDDEMLTLVREDIQNLVEGTFLQDAPVVPLSSITGEGLDDLLAELEKLVDTVKPRDRSGAYFMPIDRAFPVSGFGTVVTGTAYKGSIAPGDQVQVWPSGLTSRIRTVQVHSRNVDRAWAGQRVAICLSDIDLDAIHRGDVICAQNVYRPTTCIDTMLHVLPYTPEPITHWQRVHLHIGTSDVLAHTSLLDTKTLAAGETAPVQLVLEGPVVATIGQKYIIRHYSPLRTIGGGEILDPYAHRPTGKKRRAAQRERLIALSRATTKADHVLATINVNRQLAEDELIVRTQQPRDQLEPILDQLEAAGQITHIRQGQGTVLSKEATDAVIEQLRTALKAYHASHPEQPGLSAETLINANFPEDQRRNARAILDLAISRRRIKDDDGTLSLPRFVPINDPNYAGNRAKLMAACEKRAYQLPTIDELPDLTGIPARDLSNLIETLKKNGDVAILQSTYVLCRPILENLMGQLGNYPDGFTLAQIRDLTASSRKYILPILEYLDGRGITRRAGDKRILLKKPTPRATLAASGAENAAAPAPDSAGAAADQPKEPSKPAQRLQKTNKK